ncbi:sugar ABC transporter permease [Actinotalea sp. M2MS4P-6]|uniref:carbohydrate ABC transporter permease n=1 Tax=Actinotalea sp. M2MS4P-6 TaxID=2983762 RepID=UPI0021E4FBB6|nr:sugar ABC transporter permease [Actinotalea sp. M2MS4P-6]MCV2395128.1 sugar ABC transporter permease [Actinotalea sp. M2MS4P-6]
MTGLLFAAPATALVAVFVLYPVIGTFRISLTDWDGFSPDRTFIGFANYSSMFADSVFWDSVGRNVLYIAGLFVAVTIGFLIAVLLWTRPRGWVVFRTVFLVPEMMGASIVGIIWLQLWQPVSGGLAAIGKALGIPFLASSPLANPQWAIIVLVLTQVWASTGFYVVISLGGLQNIDPNLLDAASVDGASRLQRLWHVVIPQMRPYLALMTMLAGIAGLRAFDLVWIMTAGGPGNATQLLGTSAYTMAFSRNEFGQAGAIAMTIVVLALVFTAITGRSNTRES